MFNEAFWFFYMVSVAEGLSFWLGAVGLSGLFVSLFVAIMCRIPPISDVERVLGKVALRVLVPVCLVFSLLSIVIPPKEAFYAGAGQYVAEASEIDDTLISLKDLLDKKIEELTDE